MITLKDSNLKIGDKVKFTVPRDDFKFFRGNGFSEFIFEEIRFDKLNNRNEYIFNTDIDLRYSFSENEMIEIFYE